MSVIAAKVYPDHIDIACDSILIKDDLKKTNFKKIFDTGLVCAGGCGSAEELAMFFQYIQQYTPECPSIKGILDYMRNFSRWKYDYINDDVIHNCYLIVYRGQLFEVDGMFVQKITDHTAIGEGEEYALAALHLGHSVEEAVQTACDLCCFVAEPVVKYKVVQH